MLKSSKQKGSRSSRSIKLLCYNLITAGKPRYSKIPVEAKEKVTTNSVMLFATLTDNNYN